MKTFKKALGFLMVFCVIICVVSLPVNAKGEQRFGRSILSQMDNAAALVFVYDKLVDGVGNCQQSVSIQSSTHKVTWDEVSTVYRVFHNDYPEYFWINGACTGSVNSSTGIVISVTPKYTMSGSALQNAKADFNAKVNSLISGLEGKSDYEKSLILHDRLAYAVDYMDTSNDQNAYGALVEGKAVCAGYTRAYQHLLSKVGLESWYVSGTSINPTTKQTENHAWNLVYIDYNWYFTDVTWDDQDEEIFYGYFNLTTKQINEDHTPGEFGEYLPNAAATNANYFVKNDLVFTSEVEVERLAALLKNGQNNSAHVYTTGNVNLFEINIKSNISNIVKKMGVPSYMGYTYNMSILGREFIISFEFSEKSHRHNPTVVAAKSPTCTAKGNKEYYSCYCGKWFTDATATTEITDKNSIILSTAPHTISEHKYDQNNHWTFCKECGSVTPGSHSPHADKDKNGKCDTCAAKVAVVSTSKPVDSFSSVASGNNVSQSEGEQNTEPSTYTDVDKTGPDYIVYIGAAIAVIVLGSIVILFIKKRK